MKLLIDMNLSPSWVQFLANAGFSSVHWSSVGDPAAPDSEIVDFAAKQGLVIFTHDLDFGAPLARRNARQRSVLQIRSQDVLPAAIGEIVVRAIRSGLTQLESGALVTIDPIEAESGSCLSEQLTRYSPSLPSFVRNHPAREPRELSSA